MRRKVAILFVLFDRRSVLEIGDLVRSGVDPADALARSWFTLEAPGLDDVDDDESDPDG